MSTTTIDLLRHGTCEDGDILRGSTDDCLSDLGWQQMKQATQHNPGWDQIVTSPLQRCCQFAQQLAGQLQLPITIDDNWRELHFGDWDGQSKTDLWQQQPDLLRQYFADPEACSLPGSEPISEFKERLQRALDSVLAAHSNSHVLLVQHGGTIRFLLSILFNFPASQVACFEVPYASMTRVSIYRDDNGITPVLISHNPEGIR